MVEFVVFSPSLVAMLQPIIRIEKNIASETTNSWNRRLQYYSFTHLSRVGALMNAKIRE